MSRKPTIVLVPGAWHHVSTWDKVTRLMQPQGYKCVPVALPTTASDPTRSFVDDLEAARSAILAETTQGRDVVVVVHSYGGMVGESAVKDLAKSESDPSSSSNDNLSGHVLGIILMATGFVRPGLSFLDGLGGKPPPTWKLDAESGYAVITAEPRELFYHDLPEEEGNYWVSQLTQQSLKALTEGGEHGYAGWMDVPVWYLMTTADKAFPVEAQRMMAQMAKDAGADVTLREVESGHSPMLSRPEETVSFILEAVTAFVA